MKSPEISVLMWNYNYDGYLAQAVESVLSQSWNDFELIIIDDGSTDSSWQLLRNYQEKYPEKIFIFQHEGGVNRGIAESYGLALAKARGEWIAFLEADDLWLPDALRKRTQAARACPRAGVIYTDYEPFGVFPAVLCWKMYAWMNRRAACAYQAADLFASFLKRNPIASFSHFMTRKSLLTGLPPLQASAGGRFDWWVLGHLSCVTEFCFVPEKLTRWRIHKKSALYGRMGVRAIRELLVFLKEYSLSLESFLSLIPDNGQRLRQIAGALGFLRAVEEKKRAKALSAVLRNPVTALRFAGFVAARNLLFQP